MKKLIAVAIAGCLLFGQAQAEVIYDESVSGDLDTFDTRNFSLLNGVNTVLGQGSFGVLSGIDFDGFLFQLSAGQTLTSVVFRVVQLTLEDDTGYLFESFNLASGAHGGAPIDTVTVSLFGSETDMFDGVMPRGAGTYGFDPRELSREGAGGSWTYAIDFTVTEQSQIPEPASLALLGFGLAGLGFSRRKRT